MPRQPKERGEPNPFFAAPWGLERSRGESVRAKPSFGRPHAFGGRLCGL